jgi:hypothetical protein
MCDLDHTQVTGYYTQLGSCHGPAGGAPAAGVGGGGCRPSAGFHGAHTTRHTRTHLARQGEIATKTQELRPALSVNTQPNYVLPLAHFGAISDVCDGGVVRTDRHSAGERSGGTRSAIRPEDSPCICWWLARPITGQASSTAATLE